MRSILALAAIFALAFASAPSDSDSQLPPATREGWMTFEEHVRPIFRDRCLSCHGEKKKKGDLDLRTVASIRRGGNSGPALVPGSLQDSVLWQVVGDKDAARVHKLPDQQKKLIRAWIVTGANDWSRPH
jgi:hypothetical protein